MSEIRKAATEYAWKLRGKVGEWCKTCGAFKVFYQDWDKTLIDTYAAGMLEGIKRGFDAAREIYEQNLGSLGVSKELIYKNVADYLKEIGEEPKV